MKHILVIAQCCICFLLATTNVNAQNNAPQQPKMTTDETALKPSNKPTTPAKITPNEPVLKPIPPDIKTQSGPAIMPDQKSQISSQTISPEQNKVATPELKAIALSPTSQKGLQPKINDRPTISTITTAKKPEPPKPSVKILQPDE